MSRCYHCTFQCKLQKGITNKMNQYTLHPISKESWLKNVLVMQSLWKSRSRFRKTLHFITYNNLIIFWLKFQIKQNYSNHTPK